MDLTIAVLLIDTKKFKYAPVKGEVREIELHQNYSIKDPHDELVRWQVGYDSNRRVDVLNLFNETGLMAVLKQHPRYLHEWEGRDRRFPQGKCRLIADGKSKCLWTQEARKKFVYLKDADDKSVFDDAFVKMLGPIRSDMVLNPKRIGSIKSIVPDEYLKPTTCICIVACDRINYFEKVVASIAKNPEAYELPIYVFLDKPEDNIITDMHVEVLDKYKFPMLVIRRRNKNFGCGRNIIDARRIIFDDLGYERAFIFEDDLVISPQYMRMCINMMDWGEKNYANVGAVQGWNYCTLDIHQKALVLESVEPTFLNLWGYLVSKRCWDSIKDFLYRYQRLFLRQPYDKRNHELIRKWLHHQSRMIPKPLPGESFPVDENWFKDKDKHLNWPVSGQDGTTMTALYLEGWVRLTATVNRSNYIGESGIHQTPERYKSAGLHLVKLDEFVEDETTREFIPYKSIGEVKGFFNYVDVRNTKLEEIRKPKDNIKESKEVWLD